MVERVAGRTVPIREEPRRQGDPPMLIARAERIRSALGWQPRYDSLETIVRTSLNWERQQLDSPWH
jgi:UDP-glucose 4-epimerase